MLDLLHYAVMYLLNNVDLQNKSADNQIWKASNKGLIIFAFFKSQESLM